jgi:hypothetical protein
LSTAAFGRGRAYSCTARPAQSVRGDSHEFGAHVIAADRQKAFDFGAQEFDLDNDVWKIGGIVWYSTLSAATSGAVRRLDRAGGTLVSIVRAGRGRHVASRSTSSGVRRAQLSEIVQRVRDG